MSVQRRDGYRLWVGGPVPPGAIAITIGTLIIVRRGFEDYEDLLRHELVHVRQWESHGFVGFALRYLCSYAKWRVCRKGHHGAYLRIPLEIEAEWESRRGGAAERSHREERVPASR